MKKILILACVMTNCPALSAQNLDLTLIPPGTVSNRTDVDVRVGMANHEATPAELDVSVYFDNEKKPGLLLHDKISVPAGGSKLIRTVLPAGKAVGKHKVILVAKGGGKTYRMEKPIEIIASENRSTSRIDGAWIGLYHWSEREGKHWNGDIKSLTDDDWRSIVRSMHRIGMDIIVLQELFRNQEYVGEHQTTVENYKGLAFYPSKLYPGRMPIAAKDAVEAIFSEADKLGMYVFAGVGMFAWFDFSPQSLQWHKNVATELWDMYGDHASFYGFYISEEMHGSLAPETNNDKEWREARRGETVEFFDEFKRHCRLFAPAKPVMLATNSWGIREGEAAYPALLANLDILCPFAFARMPEGDLTGVEAADKLQELCDKAGAHLWLDLEAFLFYSDGALYPRDIEGIIGDLDRFPNFEKVICYQYPGVFSDPEGIRVGEESTVELYKAYLDYLEQLKKK